MSAKILDYKKDMIKVFETYRHKYDPYSLFERFLEFVIVGFDITFSKVERPFKEEEAKICMELLVSWTTSMNEALKQHEWYDLLGEVYMDYLSGTMKKHWTGQYFTPMHICDMMAKITDPGEKVGERVMDCACGSGRMLLASHVLHPGNYCCAQDIDRICCLMTVCNFIIHGVNGEVVCGDSLDPTDYRDGWRTNEVLHLTGIPCVRKIDMMESTTYRGSLATLDEVKTSKPAKSNAPAKKSAKKESSQPIQYSLFDFE